MAEDGAGGLGQDQLQSKRTLTLKDFSKIDKFDGAEDKWLDWSFVFKMTVGTLNTDSLQFMEVVEAKSEVADRHLRPRDEPH